MFVPLAMAADVTVTTSEGPLLLNCICQVPGLGVPGFLVIMPVPTKIRFVCVVTVCASDVTVSVYEVRPTITLHKVLPINEGGLPLTPTVVIKEFKLAPVKSPDADVMITGFCIVIEVDVAKVPPF